MIKNFLMILTLTVLSIVSSTDLIADPASHEMTLARPVSPIVQEPGAWPWELTPFGVENIAMLETSSGNYAPALPESIV